MITNPALEPRLPPERHLWGLAIEPEGSRGPKQVPRPDLDRVLAADPRDVAQYEGYALLGGFALTPREAEALVKLPRLLELRVDVLAHAFGQLGLDLPALMDRAGMSMQQCRRADLERFLRGLQPLLLIDQGERKAAIG